jgi:hypothetical protein
MKVLIATNRLQGTVPGDYGWACEGELVTPLAPECASPGTCGCGRGFPGLASSRATTTAMVADLDHLDHAQLRQAVHDSLERGGWLRYLDRGDAAELIDEHVAAIEMVCADFHVGAIIGRDGTLVWDRSAVTAEPPG